MRGTPDDDTDDRDHAGDERHPYVDLRGRTDDDTDPGEGDDERAPAVTRRPAARKTARRPSAKRRGRAKQGTELAGGALIVMTLIGFGAYALATHVLGLPRDVALVLGGLAAGLTPLAGRAILTGRRRLGGWITPGRARS